MKGFKIVGILVAVVGVLVALTPTVLLPVCQELVKTAMGAFVPMRCHYTAQAEIAVGGLLAFVGVLLFVYGDGAKINGVLNAIVFALGGVVTLIPTVLIGTCGAPDHACNVGAKPALILLGALTMLIGAGGVWQAWRAGAPPTASAAAA